MKRILGILVAVVLIFTVVMSFENIDSGNIGIKVNKFGTGRGVSGVTECTGTVFYNPLTTNIYHIYRCLSSNWKNVLMVIFEMNVTIETIHLNA